MSKATTCKVCGAPRDPRSRYVLCTACAARYRQRHVMGHYLKTHPAARVGQRKGDSRRRLDELKGAYVRLGLCPGRVWKAVLGE